MGDNATAACDHNLGSVSDPYDPALLGFVESQYREILEKAGRYLRAQANLEDQLVEGLIYIVEEARMAPEIHRLVTTEAGDFGENLALRSGVGHEGSEELWAPILREAQRRGELPVDLDLSEASAWLNAIQLMFVRQIDVSPNADIALREILRTFALPSLLSQSPAL